MSRQTGILVCLILNLVTVEGGIFGFGREPHKVPNARPPPGLQDVRIPAGFEIEESVEAEIETNELRMPGVTLKTNETYLCAAFPLDRNQPHYIVDFKALADAHHVHHILLFGCDDPGSDVPAWDCGEMSSGPSDYLQSPVCNSKSNILFAWAKDAPHFQLPSGVGYKVGGPYNSRNLILQVHYMHEEPKEDYSGLRIVSTTVPQPRTAATLLVVTGGTVKAHETTNFEAACVVDEPVVMHPFAYRVHTHKRGVDVAGYVIAEDSETGEDHWYLVGRRDPQLPQLFAPVENSSMIIQPGDIIASKCTMKNDENRDISVGGTGDMEMCNFYIAYYVEGEKVLEDNTCYSPGAPTYTWKNTAGLNHIPK